MIRYLGMKRALGLSFGLSALGGISILFYEMGVNLYSLDSATSQASSDLLFPALVLITKMGLTSAYNSNVLTI